jgi:hypothetical protein
MWVPDGTLTSAWTPGSYTVVSETDVQGLNGAHSLGYALLTAPEVNLTADRTVDLDASRVRRVKVATAKPTSVIASRIDVYRSFTSSEPTPNDQQALHQIIWPSAAYDSLWALPTGGKVKHGSFVFTTRLRAQQPPLEISYGGHRLDDAPLVQPGTPQLPDGTEGLDAVFAGTGSQAEYSGLKAHGKAVVVRSSDGVTPADQATAAHDAGAAMLVVVNEGDGRLSDWYGDADGRTSGKIPVASVSLSEGEALIKKISGTRKSTVQMKIESHSSPKYLYDLVDYHNGGVPTNPSATTDPGSLARIDLDFAPPSGEQVMESREDSPAYEYGPAANPHAVYGEVRVAPFPTEMVAPGPRTDYVSAGNGIKWQQYASINGWRTYTDVASYRPGSVQKDRWFGPITRPRMTRDEIPYRGENSMSGYIMGFGDGGSAHSGDSGTMTRKFALYQGDQLLTQGGVVPTFGAGDLATRKLPYRLVVDTAGNSELSPYSTTTHTEWSFDSAAPTGDVQAVAVPLVQLDYGIDLDLAGRAKRTADFSVTPTVLGSHSAQDTTSSIKFHVSYDDGASWQQETLREKNGTWKGALHAPRHAGYVSIRLTARQHNGGGVTQTVVRAFGLK